MSNASFSYKNVVSTLIYQEVYVFYITHTHTHARVHTHVCEKCFDVFGSLCVYLWGCVSSNIRMKSTRAPGPRRDWHIVSSLSPFLPSLSHHPLQPFWKRISQFLALLAVPFNFVKLLSFAYIFLF